MTIVGLHHVQLAMPPGREEDATAFYEDLLGIPRVEKPPNLEARGGCWFESDSARVHLGVEKDFSPARKAHPASSWLTWSPYVDGWRARALWLWMTSRYRDSTASTPTTYSTIVWSCSPSARLR